MYKYKFDGNWYTILTLPTLSKFCFEKTIETEKIAVYITDERDFYPYPTKEQISAIEFIANNESVIYNKVCDAMREKIIPYWYQIDSDFTTDLGIILNPTNEQIKNYIRLTNLSIDIHYISDTALVNYYFQSIFDTEHGLCMAFQNDIFLDFGTIGDYTHEKIMTTEEFNIYIEKLNKKYPTKFYFPNPETGKLKPWQESANSYYPFGLLHENKTNELIKYLYENPNILKESIKKLIEVANFHKKYDLIKELELLEL